MHVIDGNPIEVSNCSIEPGILDDGLDLLAFPFASRLALLL